jgi:hypothetical protein
MPPGHDGPYRNPETSVRNTAHWLITWLKVYELTGEIKYRQSAEQAINYLTSPAARPMKASFWCLTDPHSDLANGLVGQAWAIEALVLAAQQFSRSDLLELCEEVFNLHPYNRRHGAWRVVNVDGSYRSYDPTFNHQLWFAAVGALLVKAMDSPTNSAVVTSVSDFMNKLETHFATYPSGLIKHHSSSFLKQSMLGKAFGLVRTISDWRSPSYTPAYMKMKSAGYHGFNLYGFALLYSVYPDHPFWKNQSFIRSLEYADTVDFKNLVKGSKYGYPYNPPGFEVAYAIQTFQRSSAQSIGEWVNRQLEQNFDWKSYMLALNCHDPANMAARIYEAVRLDNCPVNVSDMRLKVQA